MAENDIVLAAIGALVVVAIIVFFLLKSKKGARSNKGLLRQQSILKEELKIAEAKLLKHKIDQKAYQEILDRNQKQLVEIEALLSSSQGEKAQQETGLSSISSKKKHVLEELLAQKRTIKKEISIAEKKYFKRQINPSTYREILEEKQKQLVSLEAEIKKMYADETVEQVKKELVEKLKRLEEDETQDINKYAEAVFNDVSSQEKGEEREEPEKKEHHSRRHH